MENKINLTGLSSEVLAYISALEKENLELKKLVDKLSKLVDNKESIIKKMNVERFVSKKDAPLVNTGLKSTIVHEKKVPGRKKSTKNFNGLDLETLSKENEPITLDVATSLCKENPDLSLTKMSEESTYLIKRIKASVKVYKVIIPVYKDKENKIYRASNTLTPIHHSIIDASLLSDAITMKYFLGVPEYRYAKWLKAENLPFSQKTLNNWALESAEVLKPFYNYIKSLFTDSNLEINNIHIDETWLDVISNKSQGRDKNYVFCYSGKCKYGIIPLFEYSKTRETTSVKANLKTYYGAITVDGYKGYDNLENTNITKQRCFVHARRQFADIVKTLNEKQLKTSEAYKVVNLMDEIFECEAKMKEQNLSAEEKVKKSNSSFSICK